MEAAQDENKTTHLNQILARCSPHVMEENRWHHHTFGLCFGHILRYLDHTQKYRMWNNVDMIRNLETDEIKL